MPVLQQSKSIDDVLEELDQIIARAKREGSRHGYFAALYRKVTQEVKRGIQGGYFEDNDRMERLDVLFAGRYLKAVEAHQRGGACSDSWTAAFDAGERWRPIVLQHLLLGMNAHINLDLGIAAAEVASQSEIHGLKTDFNRINDILVRMTLDVEKRLAEIWPLLRAVNKISGKYDDVVLNFSLVKARKCAWKIAEELAYLSPEEKPAKIQKLDRKAAVLARLILHPGALISSANYFVRWGEKGSVSEIIDLLRR